MDRAAAYRTVATQLSGVLADCDDVVLAMSSACALLKEHLGFFWVGFYLVEDDGSLKVGPYQGPLPCLRLPPGRGVCGDAVRNRQTIVVPDVEAHTDHIACDSRSRSEVVVPLIAHGGVLGVLDVDSESPDDFGEIDRSGLEAVATQIVRLYP